MMIPTVEESITTLVKQVEKNARGFTEYFKNRGFPEPSFDHGDNLKMGEELPPDIATMREAAIEASHELHDLLLGPTGLIVECSGQVCIVNTLSCVMYIIY